MYQITISLFIRFPYQLSHFIISTLSLSLSLRLHGCISHLSLSDEKILTHNEKEKSYLNLRNTGSTFWQLRQLSKSPYRRGSHNFDLILHYYIDLKI